MSTTTNYAALLYSGTGEEKENLEQLVRDFPVSNAARFLRLYHLKKNNDPDFEKIARETAIYLTNPGWAEYQLWQSDHPMDAMNEDPLLPSVQDELVELPPVASLQEEERTRNEPPFDEKERQKLYPSVKDELIKVPVSEVKNSETISSESSQTDPLASEPVSEQTVHEQSEIPVSNLSENHSVVEEKVIEENIPGEDKVKEEESKTDNVDPALPQEIIEDKKIEADTPASDPNNGFHHEKEPVEEKNEDSPQNTENKEPDPSTNGQITQIPLSDNEIVSISANDTGGEDRETVNNSEEQDKDISFEPLHTIDYFASQGIKLSEEALNNDALGKQVKSFTAWLKSMKRLHPDQLPQQNEVIEKIIQSSSEASNKEANVLTEAMAEVLIMQGKREKAIEMYEKLSLINPSKSAYFAAKIQNLKSI